MSLFQSLGSVGPDKLRELVNDCNETEGTSPCPHLSSGEHAPTEEAGHDANAIATGRLESGCMQYGYAILIVEELYVCLPEYINICSIFKAQVERSSTLN